MDDINEGTMPSEMVSSFLVLLRCLSCPTVDNLIVSCAEHTEEDIPYGFQSSILILLIVEWVILKELLKHLHNKVSSDGGRLPGGEPAGEDVATILSACGVHPRRGRRWRLPWLLGCLLPWLGCSRLFWAADYCQYVRVFYGFRCNYTLSLRLDNSYLSHTLLNYSAIFLGKSFFNIQKII